MIEVTELKGTNSIASDRITINDNFSIVTNGVNNILGIINIETGKIDNSTIGSDNTIVTRGITVTELGIDLTTGNIALNDGNILLNGENSYISFGQITPSKIEHITVPSISNPTTVFSNKLDLGTFDTLGVARTSTATRLEIDTTSLVGGELVWDIDLSTLYLYSGSAWVALATV